jgi:hypothetical protein
MRAFCYRSGEIEFGTKIPGGAMPLGVSRRSTKLREIVGVLARRAYDGQTLLVPGVPEADDDDMALDAVRYMRECITMRLKGQRGWPASPRRQPDFAAASASP